MEKSMKTKVKKIVVVGGGVGGWLSASWLKTKHPELDITLIESDRVGTIGIGESVLPRLGTMLSDIGLEEREWMSYTHSIYKLGNKFVGWNIPGKRDHVTNHWWPSKFDESYYGFSYALPEEHLASSYYNQLKTNDLFHNSKGKEGIDDKWNDYWLQLARDGRKNLWEIAQDTQEATYLMDYCKSPYDMNDNLMLGSWESLTYHIDANRFPKLIKDRVAIPKGVKHIHGHISEIKKDADGYISSVVTDTGKEYNGDLFLDCTGFHRVLTKEMDVEWKPYDEITTDNLIFAPIKYNDPVKEMRPYTMSNAMDEGWLFIISLYNRMGSGYIFDASEISPEDAMKKYKKYWEGHEFIREPRHIKWDAGKYDTQWNNNVVSIGMTGGMIEPMEANVLALAQAGMKMVERIISRANENDEVIGKASIKAYNSNLNWLFDNITKFVDYHYTLSDRTDTPFWAKKHQRGIDENHKEEIWKQYRNPRCTPESGVPDYMWAQVAVSMDKFDDDVELHIRPDLLEKANESFEWLRKSSKRNGIYAPNAYEWNKKMLFGDRTHSEVLEESLKPQDENS